MTRPLSRPVPRWAVFLVVAALLQGLALLVTPHAQPIYDGIGFPDEPYRFVDPPAGYRLTEPPTTAQATVPVANGRSTGGHTISSAESGPQVSLLLAASAVQTAPGVSTVVVTAKPVPLTGATPPGHVWGNVYRVSFTTASGPARQAAGSQSVLFLRSPSFQTDPTFYVRHGSTWSELHTAQSGRDIYQTHLAGQGDYVLTGKDPLNLSTKDPNDEGAVGIVGLVVSGVLVLVVVVVFVRAERRRSRRRAH